MVEAEIVVRLKKGVADPEGANVAKTLKLLGYQGVAGVSTAKVYRIDLDTQDPQEAQRLADQFCTRLLANPVIQTYQVTIL